MTAPVVVLSNPRRQAQAVVLRHAFPLPAIARKLQSHSIANQKPGWLRRARPRTYALIIVGCLVSALAYKLRVEGIFACPADGYATNSYLADCQAKGYGDYDHGAMWFGLEPQALRAAAEAEVLFVGNSRLQLAMSSKASADRFARPAVRHFLLGFSHSETVVFTQPLLAKIKPQAKVYVVNVDRFFDDRNSPPTQEILRSGDILARYREKQVWQSLHSPICGTLPALCGQRSAIYRSQLSGAWQRHGNGPDEKRPVSDGPASQPERWSEFVRLGESFLAQLPVERKCVLLTLVPSVDTKRAEAAAIASALGFELIAPQVDGLKTFDGSHLDAASAERWSAAFLEAAGPQIRECLKV